MILGEFGNSVIVDANEDISLNQNTLILRGPAPYRSERVITAAEGLTLGIVDKTLDGNTFTANQYVEYKIKDGDITHAGDWELCLESVLTGDIKKILGPLTFAVTSC